MKEDGAMLLAALVAPLAGRVRTPEEFVKDFPQVFLEVEGRPFNPADAHDVMLSSCVMSELRLA